MVHTHTWSSLLLLPALVAVSALPSLRKLPPSNCKQFKQPSMWMRHTKLFEPAEIIPKKPWEDPLESVAHQQHFTVACRPAMDVENRLGIPWHVVLTRMNHTDNRIMRAVLRRSLGRLGFRHIGMNGDVVPHKFAHRKGGLRSAFQDRLPDSYYITVLPDPREHCLSHLLRHGEEHNLHDKIHALGLCQNTIHKAVRWSKGQSPEEVVAGYDLTIPVDRMDEALLIMRRKLGLDLVDIMYIRDRNIVTALTPGEKEALDATGSIYTDSFEECGLLAKEYFDQGYPRCPPDVAQTCPRSCDDAQVKHEAEEKEADKAKLDALTTEAPSDDDDSDLLDDDEVEAKRVSEEEESAKREEEEDQTLDQATQDFMLRNRLDFELLSAAHAKLNGLIANYGHGFHQDLKKFRDAMFEANTVCSMVAPREEDQCLREVVERGSYGDL